MELRENPCRVHGISYGRRGKGDRLAAVDVESMVGGDSAWLEQAPVCGQCGRFTVTEYRHLDFSLLHAVRLANADASISRGKSRLRVDANN